MVKGREIVRFSDRGGGNGVRGRIRRRTAPPEMRTLGGPFGDGPSAEWRVSEKLTSFPPAHKEAPGTEVPGAEIARGAESASLRYT